MLKSLKSIVGLILMAAGGLSMLNVVVAGNTTAPQQTIQTYLDSLAQGDTIALASLIDGNMKARSYRLLTSNPAYSDSLRSRYSGVVMTIENLTPVGNNYKARVRFNYPASNPSISTFILSPVNGQWKIVDEQGQ